MNIVIQVLELATTIRTDEIYVVDQTVDVVLKMLDECENKDDFGILVIGEYKEDVFCISKAPLMSISKFMAIIKKEASKDGRAIL